MCGFFFLQNGRHSRQVHIPMSGERGEPDIWPAIYIGDTASVRRVGGGGLENNMVFSIKTVQSNLPCTLSQCDKQEMLVHS